LISPAGLVSNQHLRWLLGAMRTMAIRPNEQKVEAFVDTMAMPASRPRLRQPPWQPCVRQFVVGSPTFRTALVAVRPTRCNLHRLADGDVPILAMVGADETIHDGPAFAERLSERLPKAQVELVRDANHLLPVDQPEIVDGLLAEFLS
jgi:pimeloyl-ACP methyl ester carboxylesterase